MGTDATSLSSYGAAVRRRWEVIVLAGVLAAVIGAGIALLSPSQYQGTAKVLIGSTVGLSTTTTIDTSEIGTQSQVVTSLPVAQQVVTRLGLKTDPTSLLDDVAVSVDDTRVLTISAASEDKAESIDLANAFADEYLAYVQAKLRQQQAQSRAAFADEVTRLRSRVAALNAKMAKAQGNHKQLLTAQRQALLGQLTQLSAQRSTSAATAPSTAGEVLIRASTAEPNSATPFLRTTLLAGILGLVVGFGLALLWDRLDDPAPVHTRQS
ncbi:MAG: hypothetical protein H0V07_15680 [Propionibacteriales bacterium]|nr:hypothetical protein [Propionibacteriales bacterium]